MNEAACIARLDEWIIEIKNNAYEKYINSDIPENVKQLSAYKDYLVKLEARLRKAITDEHTEALSALGWPNELKGCIIDMILRAQILDRLQQAFTINQFNRSRKHEGELEII
jgi:hypothetical protein